VEQAFQDAGQAARVPVDSGRPGLALAAVCLGFFMILMDGKRAQRRAAGHAARLAGLDQRLCSGL